MSFGYTDGQFIGSGHNGLVGAQSLGSGYLGRPAGGAAPEMIMTINTAAIAPTDSFTIVLQNLNTYDLTIDWGDDSTSEITTYNDADLTHTYSVSGTYEVKITSNQDDFGSFYNANAVVGRGITSSCW
jgi:hypothetical protein